MWETVRLGDVATYEKSNGKGSNRLYLGMEHISGDTMKLVGKLETPKQTSTTFKFDSRHVLFGRLRPYLRKVFIPEFEGQCSTEIFCLLPSASVDRRFLAHWLLHPSISKRINETSTGARMPRANMNAIQDFRFSYPSLAEQERIVAKIDAAFAEIDKAIKAVENKKRQGSELFKKILVGVIDEISDNAATLKLKDIAKFLDYRGKTPEKSEVGVKLLTAKNVRMGFIKEQPQEFVSPEGYRQHMTRGFPKVGDVIFTTEAPLGLVAQIEDDSVALGQRLITFQILNNLMESTYLKYLLMSETYQTEIHNKGTGATVKGIKASLLKEIEISYPVSLDEQRFKIALIEGVEEYNNMLQTNCDEQISLYIFLKAAILEQELQSDIA
jgi:type I restriction enzyme S subunit